MFQNETGSERHLIVNNNNKKIDIYYSFPRRFKKLFKKQDLKYNILIYGGVLIMGTRLVSVYISQLRLY